MKLICSNYKECKNKLCEHITPHEENYKCILADCRHSNNTVICSLTVSEQRKQKLKKIKKL